jgi:hypothetical protein
MDESNRIPPDLAAFAETADENWPYFSIRLIYRDEDGDQVYEHIASDIEYFADAHHLAHVAARVSEVMGDSSENELSYCEIWGESRTWADVYDELEQDEYFDEDNDTRALVVHVAHDGQLELPASHGDEPEARVVGATASDDERLNRLELALYRLDSEVSTIARRLFDEEPGR